jgi:hypothetical protein
VRGIGNLPDAVNARITRAHATADIAEGDASESRVLLGAGSEARAQLEAVVKKLEARGLSVAIVRRDERLVITLLRHLPPDEIQKIAGAAVLELEAAEDEDRDGEQRE